MGDRVGVLVRVRHARKEFEVCIALGIAPDDVTDLADPVVRGAHECAQALVVGHVEDVHDGVGVLETHLLRPSFLLRHVVDTEKLVVSEEQPVHHPLCGCCTHLLVLPRTARAVADVPLLSNPANLPTRAAGEHPRPAGRRVAMS